MMKYKKPSAAGKAQREDAAARKREWDALPADEKARREAEMQREFALGEREMAGKAVKEWMDNAIASAERQVEELKRYRADFDEAMRPRSEQQWPRNPEDVMGSFMNKIMWTSPNMRLDSAPYLAVRLSKAMDAAKADAPARV